MNVIVSVFSAVCLYVIVALAVVFAFCWLFRRQNARRDPFILCRSCVRLGECHAPAGDCATIQMEDKVRKVLDAIPQFKDI